MVMAHSHCPIICREAISLFHMPLFFLASGYCFKEEYIYDISKFINKRIKRIWWPYVKWMILFILLHNIFFHLNILNDMYGLPDRHSSLYSPNEIITHCIRAAIFDSSEDLLGGFWFLKSLFWGSFIFYVLITAAKRLQLKKTIKFPFLHVGFMLLLISWLLSIEYREFTVLHISSWDFHAAFFIWCGFAYKKVHWECDIRLTVLFGITSIIIGVLYWPCSMTDITFTHFLPFTITAILSTWMCFSICRLVHLYIWKYPFSLFQGIFRFIGDNTMTILTWHFLSFKLVSLFLIIKHSLPIEQLAEYPVIKMFDSGFVWIAYSCVGLFIPLLLAVLNKYIKYDYLRF